MRNEKVMMMRVNLLNQRVNELELALAASEDQRKLLKFELEVLKKKDVLKKKSKVKSEKE